MTVTIYHNPACGTSRNTLAMIRQSGEEPEVIEYLKTPPSRARLVELIAALGISPRALLREKGTPYAELGLADPKWTDDELIDFMLAHPILINRPIVVTAKGVRLCRPSELVLDLLDNPVAVLRQGGRRGGDAREGLRRARLLLVAIARHNRRMELTPRLRLMNWLVSQGLTGLPENDLIRGFCERCRAEGLHVSRGMVFIDTLHPIFEGRGFRWNDAETNESDVFEYGSTSEGEAAEAWRSSIFYHMLENGHEELPVDLVHWRRGLQIQIHGRPRREGPQACGGLCASVRRGRHHGADGLRLFLLGDPARRGLWFGRHGRAARPGAGAGACDQDRGAGRYRQDAGPGLSRARRRRAGAAWQNRARRHRAHQRRAVVLRPARLDRDQRKHRARRDHSVPQRLCAGLDRRHP